jgi:hypothetical protein
MNDIETFRVSVGRPGTWTEDVKHTRSRTRSSEKSWLSEPNECVYIRTSKVKTPGPCLLFGIVVTGGVDPLSLRGICERAAHRSLNMPLTRRLVSVGSKNTREAPSMEFEWPLKSRPTL